MKDIKPKYVDGFIPDGIIYQQFKDAKTKHEIKKQRRHDYLVASYGFIGGGIMGIITSIITLKLTGIL